MENITSTVDLKNAIQSLQAEQIFQKQLLKERFVLAYESIKPANIIKNTMNDIAASPYLLDNIASSFVGLATGFITRKIVVGPHAGLIKKILGSILQFGITNVVSKNPETLKLIGRSILQRIIQRKRN